MEESVRPEGMMNTMEREIRNLERMIRNAEEEQGQWYKAYEDEFGEEAREKLEEEIEVGR